MLKDGDSGEWNIVRFHNFFRSKDIDLIFQVKRKHITCHMIFHGCLITLRIPRLDLAIGLQCTWNMRYYKDILIKNQAISLCTRPFRK